MTPDTQDQICRTIVFLQCFSNNYVVNLELETNWPDGFELYFTTCLSTKNASMHTCLRTWIANMPAGIAKTHSCGCSNASRDKETYAVGFAGLLRAA